MGYINLGGRTLLVLLFSMLVLSCSSGDDGDDMDDSTGLELEGRYSGMIEIVLNGDLITVPVTMTVSENSATRFSGDFFETGNFAPCCSTNPQDGTFTFNFDPVNRTIDNFIIRVDFNINPEIPCTGVYRGSGTVEFDGRSSIVAEMLFNDCNVSDTIGTLSLTRIGNL